MSGRTLTASGAPISDEQIERARAREIVNIAEDRGLKLKRRKQEYWALCCFHEEDTASLSFNPEKNVFYCHGCGAGGDAIDFVMTHDKLGFSEAVLKLADEPIPAQPSKARRLLSTMRHEVRDENDELKAIHIRNDYDDGKKSMPWLHPDGRPSNDENGKIAPVDVPLYGVHELDDADETLVVEGEKARDAAKVLGIVAVGTVTGASGTPGDAALMPLIGMRTVFWADNDAEGQKHKNRTAARLKELGQPAELIRELVWPEAPPKGDVADFKAAGGTGDGVRAMMRAAPEWQPVSATEGEKGALRFRSAREIAECVAEEPVWLLFGYVAEGAITELDGKIKSAGKTTLLTHLCRAILDGQAFLGRATKKTSIVYLTEQSPATFLQALRRAGLLDRDDFWVLFWHDTVGVKWPTVVAAARAEARRIGARALVVDTLSQFSGVKGDAENNSGAALEAMEPLQEAAAADGLAVIALRHDRKSGGEVGDSGRGSSAFSGAVDVVLQLSRPEGQSRPGVRVIKSLSRYDETPETLVIELIDGTFVTLGDVEAVVTEEARVALLKAAPTSEGESLREADLLTSAGVKRTVGQDVIREHLAEGRLQRIGAGKRGDPFRYWRIAAEDEKVSAAAPVVPAERNGAVRADSNGHDSQSAEKLSAAPKVEVPAERNRTHQASVESSPGASLESAVDSDPFLSAGTSTLGAAERNGSLAPPDCCLSPGGCARHGLCVRYQAEGRCRPNQIEPIYSARVAAQ